MKLEQVEFTALPSSFRVKTPHISPGRPHRPNVSRGVGFELRLAHVLALLRSAARRSPLSVAG